MPEGRRSSPRPGEGASRSGGGSSPRSGRAAPRSLGARAAFVLGSALVVLLLGVAVGALLIHQSRPGGGSAGLSVLTFVLLALLILLPATVLLLIYSWTRRRLLEELESLARLVERVDPDQPGPGAVRTFGIHELERLRAAFARFFDRFTLSRARQEEMEGTLGYVLDHAADAILVLNRTHQIISWNRGATETLGFAPEEILGRPYGSLVPGGVEEPELSTALAPGSTVKDFRTRRLCRDGRVLAVSLTRSRIPGPEGGDERSVEILRDITETRRRDEDLLRTEKMAAVGKISSKVVHEIRNPLATINLNVDLLRDSLESTADPEAKDVLAVIKREVRRLSQITEEYLQFSRLPRAAFRPERVNDILVELADFVRPSTSRKGIQLVLNLDEKDPEAVCDATLLRQALLNLLRNAMDATEEGQGRIQMATRSRRRRRGALSEDLPEPLPSGSPGQAGSAPPGAGEPIEVVEITVEDNGRGIPPDLEARIFEPFFTTKRDGTGLGLALVQRAVEEHGGALICRSVEGKGTTFRVIVPCRAPGAPSPEDANLPALPRSFPPTE